MFKDFGDLKRHEGEKKTELLNQVCSYIAAHTKAKERLFYPAMRYEDEPESVADIDLEQERTIRIIARLEAMACDDDHYDARVKAISEYIGHMKKQKVERMPEMKRRIAVSNIPGANFNRSKGEISDTPPS